MSATPQDRMPKKVVAATQQQAANLAQKAIIDNVIVKITLIQTALREAETHAGHIATREPGERFSLMGTDEYHDVNAAETALNKIDLALKMTRDETALVRATPEHTFPDERVQAILTEAVDKITDAILSDVA